MEFTCHKVKGIGVYGKDHLEYKIKINVEISQVKRVHDLLMCSSYPITGGRHYEYDLHGCIIFSCEVNGNHKVIGNILDDLIPWDKDSIF